MKPLNAILSASGLVLALSLSGWAQEVKQFPTQSVTLSGTLATAPTGATSTAPTSTGAISTAPIFSATYRPTVTSQRTATSAGTSM